MSRSGRSWCAWLPAALAVAGCATHVPAPVQIEYPVAHARLTHGAAIGEVAADSAVIWGRCDGRSTLVAVVTDSRTGQQWTSHGEVTRASDYTGRVLFDGLSAGRRFSVRVGCSGADQMVDVASQWAGEFRTAPASDDAAHVRLAWGGDIGGQNVCRDRDLGYPIFEAIAAERPSLFIALGDMIYADDRCYAAGRYGNAQIEGPPVASDLDSYRAVWRYNRSDEALQDLFRVAPIYPVLDDHEVRNDAGPHHDRAPAARHVPLLPIGVVAFLEYQPMIVPPAPPLRLYRSSRWGKHLEIFFLDTRQHRDSNMQRDNGASPKSMLGAEQLAWLVDGLRRSDATWKVVVSSVPISIPTGGLGRDGWADGGSGLGFERELRTIVDAMRSAPQRNFVWLTTDVHFATAFRYRPALDDPDFAFYEFVTGPLNAGMFPKPHVDGTFLPERLTYYAAPGDTIFDGIADARRWFNFGTIDTDAAGALRVRIVNGYGEAVYRTVLVPEKDRR